MGAAKPNTRKLFVSDDNNKADHLPPAAPVLPAGGMVIRPKTSAVGEVFKWIFIGFNVVMVIFLFVSWSDVANIEAPSGAEKVGDFMPPSSRC